VGPRHVWRELPYFHADLPGFGFAFLCGTFFSLAWAKKKGGAFYAQKTGF
jgi:hypothetical protein